MRWTSTALVLAMLAPSAAEGQDVAGREAARQPPAASLESSLARELGDPTLPPGPAPRLQLREAPARAASIRRLRVDGEVMDLGDRYVDTLAGTWAGAALGALAGGLSGVTLGLVFGCALGGGLGCAIGGVYGTAGGGALGWLIGSAVGVGLGAGISAGEGLGALGLGILAGGAVETVSVLIGAATNDYGWGIGGGAVLSAFTIVFVTPLFGAAFAEAHASGGPGSVSLRPVVAPRDGGATVGAAGAF